MPVVSEAAVVTLALDVLLLEGSNATEFSTLIFVSYKFAEWTLGLSVCLYTRAVYTQ